MIKSVYNYPVSTLLDIESGVIYAIPRYQREYTWSRAQWDALFVQSTELVYGQQHMTMRHFRENRDV